MDRPNASTVQRTRAINRRQQGDLGEASAIEWFSRLGATIFIPFGHSPDVDLVVELEGRMLRIQVKTSTHLTETSGGDPRRVVALKRAVAIRAGAASRRSSTRLVSTCFSSSPAMVAAG